MACIWEPRNATRSPGGDDRVLAVHVWEYWRQADWSQVEDVFVMDGANGYLAILAVVLYVSNPGVVFWGIGTAPTLAFC